MKRKIEVGDVIQFQKTRGPLWNSCGSMDHYIGTWHIITPEMLCSSSDIIIDDWSFIHEDIISHFKVGDIVTGWHNSFYDMYYYENWTIGSIYHSQYGHCGIYAKPIHHGRTREDYSCSVNHLTLVTPVEQIKDKEIVMKTGTDFKIGEHVVLLKSCTGANAWERTMPENYVYQLQKDSNSHDFHVVRDTDGDPNGWDAGGHYASKLLLRHASSREIMEYIEAGRKPVPCHDIKVSADISTETKTQTITKENLGKIHDVACTEWKAIITGYANADPFSSTVTLTDDQVKTMFKESNSDQTKVLIDAGLVKPITREVIIKAFTAPQDIDGNRLLEKRLTGEFAEQAFNLNDSFNWDIITDKWGKLCLVPTNKI